MSKWIKTIDFLTDSQITGSKYCTLLEKDGGVEVLKYFVTAQRPDNFQLPTSVKCLAVVTLFQYYLFKEYNSLSLNKSLEKSHEIQCFHLVPRVVVANFLHYFDFAHLAPELGIDLGDESDLVSSGGVALLVPTNNNNDEDDICDYGFEEVDMLEGGGGGGGGGGAAQQQQQPNDEDMLL